MKKWFRGVKYYCIRLFRLKSGAKQISLGFSLGFIPCWFPTFGIGPMLSIALAKIFKVNMVATIIAASLGSFIWPVLFIGNYQIGEWLFFRLEHMDALSMTYDFMIGAVINSILSSVILYFVLYFLFKRYRITILKKMKTKKA
ncbi:DUF2062 domain-containing protein [Chengkuizengella marina]|uniref:DUF2062 domain-containing protein n=1 Tax=Chengkuizengella marina TaxID=2507566 RepID=A0A6N9Q2H1_9BACL|nr:DUF2062 domain-containing protein [Chengkuizengella marina]NBI28844.1 DUF2062 domain-containing protein [Chengkuizengella marina]